MQTIPSPGGGDLRLEEGKGEYTPGSPFGHTP